MTPRPVEVTNSLWWALKRLNEDAECARSKNQAYIGDSTVLTSDVEMVCAALTAALRAQPAGGTLDADARDAMRWRALAGEFPVGTEIHIFAAGGVREYVGIRQHASGKGSEYQQSTDYRSLAEFADHLVEVLDLAPAPVADAGGTPDEE